MADETPRTKPGGVGAGRSGPASPPPPPWGGQAWDRPPDGPRMPDGARLAGAGRRLGAAAIDGLAGITVLGLVAALLARPAAGVDLDRPALGRALAVAAIQLVLLVPFAAAMLGWRRGGTPGMRALDLAVVDEAGGGRPSWGQCLRRAAGIPYSVVGLLGGFIWIGIDRRRRSWHDLLAGTVVVERASPPAIPMRPAAPATAVGAGAGASPEVAGPGAVGPGTSRSAWTWTDVLPVVVLYYPLGIAVAFGLGHAIRAVHPGRLTGAAVPLANALLELLVDAADIGLLYVLLRVRRGARIVEVGWGRPDPRWLVCGLPLGLAALRIQSSLGIISEAAFPGGQQTQCREIRSAFGDLLPLAVLAIAVLAPLFEETIFRGFVLGWLRGRLPAGTAVVVSAAVFSAAHFAYLQPTLFLPIFGTGLLLGAVYQLSRSIWAGVVIHGAVNLVALLVLLTGASDRC